MAYSGVFVFGDSLIDSGNALKLAETYDYFPFTSLPDGAPTAAKGYHSGNFTNGWTLADLIANKYLGVTTKSVFPFGYDEPYLGISFGFVSDPSGNNLNFAYGGAQLRQGDEAVPDIDDQTDAFRDAVDGDADPNALHIFSFGANDLHDLVPNTRAWADRATAEAHLADCADEYIEEILDVIAMGARHIVVSGVPDIGIQPIFNGTPDEAARRAIATEYADLLDQMIRDRLDALNLPDGVEIHYVSWEAMQAQVIGTMANLHGDSAIYPLEDSELVFFDQVHPTAQVHALGAAYILDLLGGAAGEQPALTAPQFALAGAIGAKGEVDTLTVVLAANTSYSLSMLGISTLGGNVSVLADPMLRIYRPDGSLLGSNDDGGLGLDASLTFTSGAAGEYRIQLSGVGVMTGGYVFQAAGQAGGNDSYNVATGATIVLEGVGGGTDTVRASVNYVLNAGAEVEYLRTGNDKGKGAINLTGNEYAQAIIGNAGSNVLDGRGGADTLTGGVGKDIFVLANTDAVDRIMDYASGDVVDLSQLLSVAAGINVTAGGFVRVTTGGLIQIDSDGGGNNWVTLATINGSGPVSLRYLSGGTPTTLSVARVATTGTTAIAASVAAAGLAATPLEGEAAVAGGAEHHLSPARAGGMTSVAEAPQFAVRSEPWADGFETGGNRIGFESTGSGSSVHHQLAGWATVDPAIEHGGHHGAALGTSAGAEAHSLHPLAMTVAMPSAEMLQPLAGPQADTATLDAETARALAEALGAGQSEGINALLEALPGATAELFELRQLEPREWDWAAMPTLAQQGIVELALVPDQISPA